MPTPPRAPTSGARHRIPNRSPSAPGGRVVPPVRHGQFLAADAARQSARPAVAPGVAAGGRDELDGRVHNRPARGSVGSSGAGAVAKICRAAPDDLDGGLRDSLSLLLPPVVPIR